MNETIRQFEKTQVIRKAIPFKVGDTVKVSLRIKEGEKERIQAYEGVVIGLQGRGPRMRFTVRKLSYGVGVEKTIFYQSPMIKELKVLRSGKVRRGKLFYLREKLTKKGARIQESKRAVKVPGEEIAETAATQVPEPVAPVATESSAPAATPVPAETTPKA